MARMFLVLVMMLSGTASSQLPEFTQQYFQRLGGAIDALQVVIHDFQRDAAAFGLTIDEAIKRQGSSDDPFVRARGESMEAALERLNQLQEQQIALKQAGSFQRILIFAQGFDRDLAQAAAEDFQPAVPVTAAGFASAAFGALAGFLLVRALFLARFFRRRRRPVAAS
ncbi:DUF2937 family protein [Roseibium denhamense]|uniref:DUF2937 family protein n=1 Tax=Roseibium denhamense TaxID=76305 RepID=A0ABY1NL13_9HYPH|nr:DUF2937 family protein [Roseibium denhamense]MTI06871.1 DUF2937 family protein [Roseibium denhamense]SMP12226.1 Protein of unknown function [Roseibium denhamense]